MSQEAASLGIIAEAALGIEVAEVAAGVTAVDIASTRLHFAANA